MKRVFTTPLVGGLCWCGIGFAEPDVPKDNPVSMGASIRTGRIEFINDTIVYLSPARRLQQDLIKAFVQNPTYIDMKNVRMHITDEGLLIEFFNDPRHRVFADGQAELSDYGKLLICVTASKLASRGKASIIKIEVQGPVSQKFKPAEKDADALSISTARALNAYRLLIHKRAKENAIPKSKRLQQIESVEEPTSAE